MGGVLKKEPNLSKSVKNNKKTIGFNVVAHHAAGLDTRVPNRWEVYQKKNQIYQNLLKTF